MSPSLQVSDDLDEPDVYEEVDVKVRRTEARIYGFADDAYRAVDEIENDLAHGNVLAARDSILSLRVHIRMLVKALDR